MSSVSLRSQLIAVFGDAKRAHAGKTALPKERSEKPKAQRRGKREMKLRGEWSAHAALEGDQRPRRHAPRLSRKARARLKRRIKRLIRQRNAARSVPYRGREMRSNRRQKPKKGYVDETPRWIKRSGIRCGAVERRFDPEDCIPFDHVRIRFEQERDVRMILERRHDRLPGVCIGIGRSVFLVCGAASDERGELIRKKQIVGVKVHGVRASHPYSAMGFWGEFEAWNEGAEGDVVICDMALPRGVIIRNGVLYGPARKSKPPQKLEVRPSESRSAARPTTMAPAHEDSERRLARIRIIYTPMGGQPGWRRR